MFCVLPWIECISEGWTGLHTFWDIPGIEHLAHSLDNLLGTESLSNKTSPCSCWKPQICRGWLCLLQHGPIQTVHTPERGCYLCMCVHTCDRDVNFQVFQTLTKIKVIQTTHACVCSLTPFRWDLLSLHVRDGEHWTPLWMSWSELQFHSLTANKEAWDKLTSPESHTITENTGEYGIWVYRKVMAVFLMF